MESSISFHWTLHLAVLLGFKELCGSFLIVFIQGRKIGSKTPANKGAQAKTQAISDLFNSRPKPVSQRQE